MTNNFDKQDKGFDGAEKREGARRPRTRISRTSAYRSGSSNTNGDRQVIRDERSGGSSQPRRYDDGRGNSSRNSNDRNDRSEGGYSRARTNSYGSSSRQGGSYGSSSREGGYSNNRSSSSREGGYSNNRSGSSYGNSSSSRQGGSYGSSSREGGYNSNRTGGSSYGNSSSREGGYNRQGGSSSREGGYSNNRQGGSSYGSSREGGYNRQGGSSSREGGYNSNRTGGSSYGSSREGGYSNNRQGGSSYGSSREGGYNSNRTGGSSSYGGNSRQGGSSYGGRSQGGSSYGSSREGGSRQGGSSYGGRSQGGSTYGSSFHDKDYDPNNKYSQRKQIEYKTQYVDYSKPMRLNKFLANAGICSRREADEFIQAGVVVVNDTVIKELGTKVIPATDKVLFHDQLVKSEKKVYILLNKPKDCVTTVEDTHSRMTVLDLVRNACTERIYPVGRLDRNTTGVLLITNDGDLTSKLTHPKYDKKKIYHAVLDKEITDDDMDKIAKGITLEDGDIKADAISFVKEGDRRQVGIEIHSGKNRIVRRIFDSIGYHVVRLDRVYFAGLTKKNLPRGRWRYLSEMEVAMLKMGSHE